MTCRFKVGDRVRLVRRCKGRNSDHGLGLLIRAQQECRINYVEPLPRETGEYYMTGTYAAEWREGGVCGFYWLDSMCDPMWNPGDLMLRSVYRNGGVFEHYLPEKDYDQMDLAAIAQFVLGSVSPVSGTKSRIDTPDCTILTIGTAE